MPKTSTLSSSASCTLHTADDVLSAMQTLENPEQRKVLMTFFKTGVGQYGEGDQFLGLKVPETRAIVKVARDLPLSEIQILLNSPWHEARLCGFLILVSQFEQTEKVSKKKSAMTQPSTQQDLMAQRDAIVDFYLLNATKANNWDLVDLSCYHILGRWLQLPSRYSLQDKVAIFDRLAASPNLWERRISMVATLGALMVGETAYTLKYAAYHIHSFRQHPDLSHDLMHKAVGWMLREMGKRCSMDDLRQFLAEYASIMPRTALRYAIEKMSPEEKTYWMTTPQNSE